MNKKIEDLNNTINQIDVTDILSTIQDQQQNTHFSQVHMGLLQDRLYASSKDNLIHLKRLKFYKVFSPTTTEWNKKSIIEGKLEVSQVCGKLNNVLLLNNESRKKSKKRLEKMLWDERKWKQHSKTHGIQWKQYLGENFSCKCLYYKKRKMSIQQPRLTS